MANYVSKHTGKQIDAAVDAFLAGGGTGSTGSVEVDATLTQSGKAADAKETGDKIRTLESKIAEIEESGGSGSDSGGTGSGSESVNTLLWTGSFPEMVASAHNSVTFGFDLKAGTKYTVKFDGTEYPVTCENLLQHAMLAMGNKSLANPSYEDNGEPFFIYQKTGSQTGQFLIVKADGAHEVEIYITVTGGSTPGIGSDSLLGKNVLLIGDSVGSGAGWSGGFANLISEDFSGVTVNNASVSGALFAGESIYYQMATAFQSGFVADYIVVDGGGNDMLNDKSLGALDPDLYSADGYGKEFDTSTLIGAFEHLVTNAQKFYPNAKIIFYNLYKLHPTSTSVPYAKQRQVWELLREGCKKYGVRYVDLYDEGNFTPNSTEQRDMFMYDWVHINEAGYRRFWPLIRTALLNT